jgi:hypothetical protein
MRRVLPIVFLCLIAFPAQALTCREVRTAVAQYGPSAVETWARWKGYSDQQISEIKRICRL